MLFNRFCFNKFPSPFYDCMICFRVIRRRDAKFLFKALTEIPRTVHSYFIGDFRDVELPSSNKRSAFCIFTFRIYSLVDNPVSAFIFPVEGGTAHTHLV